MVKNTPQKRESRKTLVDAIITDPFIFGTSSFPGEFSSIRPAKNRAPSDTFNQGGETERRQQFYLFHRGKVGVFYQGKEEE